MQLLILGAVPETKQTQLLPSDVVLQVVSLIFSFLITPGQKHMNIRPENSGSESSISTFKLN